jgi:hypothetical protein
MNAQLLVRSLVSAGSAKAPEGEEGTYMLEVADGYLVEKLWVGGHTTSETPISSDVRDNTSGVYLFPRGGDIRLVFFINNDNIVECFSFNEEVSPDWEDTNFSQNVHLVTGPESKLGAVLTSEGGMILAFQDAAGRLITVVRNPSKGPDESLGLPAVEARTGTPLRLLGIESKLHLFYIGTDGNVHALVRDLESGTWTDGIVENTNFDEPINRFDVTVDSETNSPLFCLLVGDQAWLVDKGKGKTRLGEVQADGQLIAADKAQAGFGWQDYNTPCPSCWPPVHQTGGHPHPFPWYPWPWW